MIFISHRGNTNGSDKIMENTINHIINAINKGFSVEVDVWYKDGKLFLGHENPEIEISQDFIMNDRIWCHAKTVKTFHYLLYELRVVTFYHNQDDCTLTSNGYIWTYPKHGMTLTEKSIVVCPEILGGELYKFGKVNVAGICSDFIAGYKYLQKG